MKKVKPFSLSWYLYLVLAGIIIATFSFITKDMERQQKLNFLLFFNVFELVYLIIYKSLLVKKHPDTTSFFNELPCYLCNFSTILAIVGCIYDIRYIHGYCLSVGFAGAFLAFLMPEQDFINVNLFSIRSFGFYGYHALIIVSCMSFVFTGLYIPQYGDIWIVMLIEIGCLIIAHITNFIIRKAGLYPKVNYMFTYEPTNSVIKKFYNLIPIRCIYLIPIAPIFGFILIIETLIYNLIQ